MCLMRKNVLNTKIFFSFKTYFVVNILIMIGAHLNSFQLIPPAISLFQSLFLYWSASQSVKESLHEVNQNIILINTWIKNVKDINQYLKYNCGICLNNNSDVCAFAVD